MSDRSRLPEVVATAAWQAAMPGAVAGILVMGNLPPGPAPEALDAERAATEAALRDRFAGLDRAGLRATPPLPAYDTYYRRFGQTYHVALQVESVALKGKPLPRRPPLVEAMFLAELESLLLTAGHDVAALRGPVAVDVAGPGDRDRYTGLGGKAQICKPGDMVMRDADGVFCSIIQGPDDRTRLTGETQVALFAVYAPPGIGPEPVRAHLERLAALVRRLGPGADVVALETLVAGDAA